MRRKENRINGLGFQRTGSCPSRKNDEAYGRVLRTHVDVKPVFVPAGNYIGLETAASLVMDFTGKEGHIPLPTGLADIETHEMRKAYCS